MAGSTINFTVNGTNVLTNVSDAYEYSVTVSSSSITITRKSYTTPSGTWNAPSGYEITSVIRNASNDTYDINFPIGETTDFTNLAWGTNLTVTTAVKSYGDDVKEIKAGNTYHKIDSTSVDGHTVESTGVESDTTTLPTTAQVKTYVNGRFTLNGTTLTINLD